MVTCPKCGTSSTLTHRAKHGGGPFDGAEDDENMCMRGPPDPFEGPIPVYGTSFRELYECPAHGEFGMRDDGTFEFVHPDTYVEGPNGEKLFRT